MASLKTHKRKNGKPDSYSVEWRIGGSRDATNWGYETFDPLDGEHRDKRHAELFKAAVVAAGHQWPKNYVPGTGWVDPATYQAVLDAAREEQESASAVGAKVLLADYAVPWIEKRAKDPTFGQVRKDRQYLRDYVIPAFGERDLLDPMSITKAEIEDFALDLRAGKKADERPTEPDPEIEDDEFDDLDEDDDDDDLEDEDAEQEGDVVWVRAPKSPKTIKNIVGTFSALLSSAVEDEKLPRRIVNPCSRAKLPKLEDDEGDDEMIFLDPEELSILLEAMQDDAKALTLFLFGTGLRFSEATALKVKDFLKLDPMRPSFLVRRAWKQRASNGSWYLGAPKTKAGRRRVALTPSQVTMINALIAGRGKDEFVFTGPRGGRMTHSTYYSQRWRLAVYRAMRCPECRAKDWEAGIGRRGGRELTNEHAVWCGHPDTLQERPRPHDLRHSHVAVLIFNGVHVKKIQQRLGHASVTITMDRYGHLFPEMDDQLVLDLENMLARAAGGADAAYTAAKIGADAQLVTA